MCTYSEMALEEDPSSAVAHYTLGNVYAVLMQYNKSVQSFDLSLQLGERLPWVEQRRAAVVVSYLLMS